MQARHHVRQVLNLVNLSTPLGLLLVRVGAAGRRPGPYGLVLSTGYRLPLPLAPAFTVGNVIMVRGDGTEFERRPELLVHEARHATQYALCVGPVMIVLYLACAGLSMALCGDHASYNPFERLAGLDDGGYVKRPLRFARR